MSSASDFYYLTYIYQMCICYFFGTVSLERGRTSHVPNRGDVIFRVLPAGSRLCVHAATIKGYLLYPGWAFYTFFSSSLLSNIYSCQCPSHTHTHIHMVSKSQTNESLRKNAILDNSISQRYVVICYLSGEDRQITDNR